MSIPSARPALGDLRDLVELPGELPELYACHDDLLAGTPQPRDVRPVHDRILDGESADAATDAHAADVAEASRIEQVARNVWQTRRAVEFRIERAIVTHRDAIIEQSLAPAVASIVDAARPAAATLSRFLPRLDERAMLRDGTSDELDAWRSTRQPTADLRRLLDAFIALWRGATTRPFLPTDPPPYLHLGTPGGVHTWANPRALDHVPNVRDGHDVDVVTVAAYADVGGIRLATIPELVALGEHTVLERPHVPGERLRRHVLLPRGPIDPPGPRTFRAA